MLPARFRTDGRYAMTSPDAVRAITEYPTVEQAVSIASAALQTTGAPVRSADLVAHSLVLAERMGHASHGLVRVAEYCEQAAAGQLRAAEEPVVSSRSGSGALVDGRWGWGNLAARLAADTAADIAAESSIGVVAVRHCNHCGRLGEWVERIAARGQIGIGWLSCGPAVAPLGGRDRVLGTNPLAVAVPTDSAPVVLDFATAAVAEGKVRVAARAGKSVPPGSLQRRDGSPTTDPEEFYAGGTILPFGLHKGYALSVVIQMMGDALAGSWPSDERFAQTNGLVLLALDPAHLGDPADFAAIVEQDRRRILDSRTATDAGEVLLPGEIESRTIAGQPSGRVAVEGSVWAEVTRRAHPEGAGR